MPIYEYRCRDCGAKSPFLTLSVSEKIELKCSRCGKPNLTKLVSRVAVLRSEGSRMESLADPSKLGGLDESDPASVARWMKKMGRETGEDLGEDLEQGMDKAAQDGGFGGGGMGDDEGDAGGGLDGESGSGPEDD
jgi:putative FmdB family regulatory protein